MSKNWYESSIKSLVEEFMRNHGYPIVFDTTIFKNTISGKTNQIWSE